LVIGGFGKPSKVVVGVVLLGWSENILSSSNISGRERVVVIVDIFDDRSVRISNIDEIIVFIIAKIRLCSVCIYHPNRPPKGVVGIFRGVSIAVGHRSYLSKNVISIFCCGDTIHFFFDDSSLAVSNE
jgi:hypothetical protein